MQLFAKLIFCFNRYMVECESGWIQRARLFDFVLIDTWWNVNAEDNRRCVFASVCFNRYMVECEYIKQLFRQILYSVLIDTWWNVNSVKYPPISSITFVLIDTWWNVNERIGKIRGKFAEF